MQTVPAGNRSFNLDSLVKRASTYISCKNVSIHTIHCSFHMIWTLVAVKLQLFLFLSHELWLEARFSCCFLDNTMLWPQMTSYEWLFYVVKLLNTHLVQHCTCHVRCNSLQFPYMIWTLVAIKQQLLLFHFTQIMITGQIFTLFLGQYYVITYDHKWPHMNGFSMW